MINAVRIRHPRGITWVTDSVSIATYGRQEGVLTVNEPLSDADLTRRGQAFLDTQGGLTDSVEVAPLRAVTPGVDYVQGDLVTVDGEKRRCVDIKRRLNTDNGEWLPPTPVFTTSSEMRRLNADRALDRLIAVQAGGGVDASVTPDSVVRPMEQVKWQRTLKWSWYDGADSGSRDLLDDDSRWQVQPIKEPARCTAITVTADWAGATGDTILELHRNGALWNGLFNVTLPSTSGGIEFRIVWMWGYEFLDPGDEITIRASSNGQHRQGAYELHLWPTV